MDRREFIRLMSIASGASLLHSCGVDRQTDKLIPYLVPPEEEIVPGQAVYVKSVCSECPAGCGMSVKIREGNPVKLEGLPGHPLNDGALCIRGQASLMRLYHPERLTQPLLKGADGTFHPVPWEQAFEVILTALREGEGRRHRYLSGRTTGSLSSLINRFCSVFGVLRAPELEPVSPAAVREACALLFARRTLPLYRIEDADLLVTLGADIVETFGNPVANAVRLGRARGKKPFHWIHLEPHLSLTGLQADTRLACAPGGELVLLRFLIRSVHKAGAEVNPLPAGMLGRIPDWSREKVAQYTGISTEAIDELELRLARSRKPLVIAGGVSTAHERGTDVAVLAGLLQWVTGQIPARVDFDNGEEHSRAGSLSDVRRLADDLDAGRIGTMIFARTDPLRTLGEAFSLPRVLEKAAFRVAMSDLMTDTARACDLVLPLNHALESWGDDTTWNGVTTVMQPALEPLHNTMSEGDILVQLLNRSGSPAHLGGFQKYLFQKWQQERGAGFSEALVTEGFYRERNAQAPVILDTGRATSYLSMMRSVSEPRRDIIVTPWAIRTFDGRSAALPLMQEIPDPLTTISYGRWISVSEAGARDLKLEDNDEVLVTGRDFKQTLHVKVQPLLPAGVSMIMADQIDPRAIRIDERSGERIAYIENVTIRKTGHARVLPVLSGSPSQAGRGLIPDPRHPDGHEHHAWSFYPEPEFPEYHWAMAVDLERCIGCGACVAACYIENNVPMTGRKEHLKGRELSWLRIEPYYESDGRAWFLPVMCQHCDNAPCEPVCPVYATYHNPEGLNAQIYNRCVGTRYCSNNCPYKVRRFNWFDPKWEGPLNKMHNPDISVRGRGVMEKCTFCIQRIRAARDHAKDEGRPIRDGEVMPACAQTCPTGAIQFGNLLDTNSAVYKLAHSKRAFHVHGHLGTKPSVYYLNKKGMTHDV